MTITKSPPLGKAIPERGHAISVHLPTWQDMCGMGQGEPRVMKALQNGYPRSFFHKDVRPCKSFISSSSLIREEAVSSKSISIFAIECGGSQPTAFYAKNHTRASTNLWAVVYPEQAAKLGATFWRLTGTGISSRLAEHCLQDIESIRRTQRPERRFYSAVPIVPPVYQTICNRIAYLLERAPAQSHQALAVEDSDVFLYPSGMSAIFHVHQMLLSWRGLETVIIGFPYELTIKMMESYGPSFKFYSFGTDEQVDEFEEYLKGKARVGTMIQAVWCECPSNPLLHTVDLERIRRLADEYGFVVVVDDTIGSFANVDVLSVADIVVTSLTKSFNGYADLLAGSATINPNSHYYAALKTSLIDSYSNNLYIDDAIQLEHNSRNFLKRASQMNITAENLVDYIHPLVSDPASVVSDVYYPKVCRSASKYESRMRQQTDDFTPGYGCLLTIDFETVDASIAFFDNLNVQKGPSLGANITLAQPYVQMVLQKEKKWATSHGLRETIVRISAGLEDKEIVLESVKYALMMAEQTSIGCAI
ncbi:PLP-dependent transferase [Penicillium macrosclerotiorum]|uniref:PLP-dependent transferase n=1 Tax=Penicillium macrosclerotiorum TaxID=303699 RepID=UPI002548C72D|nr:PLP-dependent transferase [Penicillium macrosclerotiorum]KAJ5674111.1 PLP-dependent transferase [Penicillium macrosclerotiorum]